jgi:hypothetical protein
MSARWITDAIEKLEAHGFHADRQVKRGWTKYIHYGPPHDVCYIPNESAYGGDGGTALMKNKQAEVERLCLRHPFNTPRVVTPADDGLAAAEALLAKHKDEPALAFDPVINRVAEHEVVQAVHPEPATEAASTPIAEADDMKRKTETIRRRIHQKGTFVCRVCGDIRDTRMGRSQHESAVHGKRAGWSDEEPTPRSTATVTAPVAAKRGVAAVTAEVDVAVKLREIGSALLDVAGQLDEQAGQVAALNQEIKALRNAVEHPAIKAMREALKV